ncbi:MAG TPA: DivIVA domain-containing protein [Mycobacteriales bacterium]
MATQHTSPRVIEPDDLDDAPSSASAVTEQFDLTFRGFDRAQVEAYLDHWGQQFWAMERERDAALLELEELRANPPVTLSPLSTMSLRLQQIVTAAEEEAALLRADAADEAQRVREAALDDAEQERAAAAAERSVATGDAQRLRSEAKEIYDQAAGEARALTQRSQAEAQQRVSEASAEADRLLAEARLEAEQIHAEALEDRDTILADARQEAAELERATAHRREIALAEHHQLLQANEAVQEKRSGQLRQAIANLQGELEQLTADVEQRRQQRAVPAPARPTPFGAQSWTEPESDDIVSDSLSDSAVSDDTAENPLPTLDDDDMSRTQALFREAGVDEPYDDEDVRPDH